MHAIIKIFLVLSSVIGITNTDAFGLNKKKQIPDVFYNTTYNTDIHTVLLRSATWELSLPVFELGSGQKLELHFDDISNNNRILGYTIVHCNTDWKASDIPEQEYVSGFGRGTIKQIVSSFNTTYDYMHYSLTFPEEECTPLISGNYALVVYNEENPDEIILTRRFYVTEKAVQINAAVKQPGFGPEKATGQQILFTVSYNNIEIKDPFNEITAIILQNNRYDNKIVLKKPFSVMPGRLEYTDTEKGIFQGGNEFRSLDLKSMKYQTQNMASIEFPNPYYHVFLNPDQDRSRKPYFSNTDLNGGYFIDREKATDKHTEADYIFVHFRLSLPLIYSNDEIYITGEFCDWDKTEKNRLKYNPQRESFETTLLLKQGLYDYCYVKKTDDGKINEYDLEGSFYETENDYTIFIYFHDFQKGTDRLIGYLPIK